MLQRRVATRFAAPRRVDAARVATSRLASSLRLTSSLTIPEGVVPESCLVDNGMPCVSTSDVLPTTCAAYGRPSTPIRTGPGDFVPRMIGPSEEEVAVMLKTVGMTSLDTLTESVVPEAAGSVQEGFQRTAEDYQIPEVGMSEAQTLHLAREVMNLNDRRWRTFIGRGFYNTHTPAVIANNVLMDPAWYSPYTPYQPEVSQGRLEALYNFQDIICELTGLPVANAGLLDVGSASCEAILACLRARQMTGNKPIVLIERSVDRHIIDVVRSRLHDVDVFGFDLTERLPPLDNVVCTLIQTPDISGRMFTNLSRLASNLHDKDIKLIAITDPLALALFEPPGRSGADVVIGSTQRLGVPMGFGGPAAAYFATTKQLLRQVPGRIVGKTLDRRGKPAYRLCLQTREQHIRRERATSNICTAQSLPAILAQFFVLHKGPQGLYKLASDIFQRTVHLAEACREMGFSVEGENSWLQSGRHFGVVTIRRTGVEDIKRRAEEAFFNLGYDFQRRIVRIAVDELMLDNDVYKELLQTLRRAAVDLNLHSCAVPPLHKQPPSTRPQNSLFRNIIQETATTPIITTPTVPSPTVATLATAVPAASNTNSMFERAGHNDTSLLRYIRSLSEKDLGLQHSVISLGSCTMKHNPSAAIKAAFGELGMGSFHPFAPPQQNLGSILIISMLARFLSELTGFECVSLQPNAGSAGELAGLGAIRAYHEQQGDPQRTICLIPTSAHGTNSASAAAVGLTCVPVRLTDRDEMDLEHLRELCATYDDQLACLMITYPSTHGTFEKDLSEACKVVHQRGGLVYVDGANLNAEMGISNPAKIGADICHVNLHKTFGIPHGGGGPGVGPVCAKAFLKSFLPNHRYLQTHKDMLTRTSGICVPDGDAKLASCVSPFGSASLLMIPWMYVLMMGRQGLRRSSQIAILNANYLRERFRQANLPLRSPSEKVCGHEFILDLSDLEEIGLTVEDVAKRLMDFGYHPPTMSWPIQNSLMIEPTESEDLKSLDAFADAMIAVFAEIEQIRKGQFQRDDNPLRNAPHTLKDVLEWSQNRPYSVEQACLPRDRKFWPTINRIDGAASDRALLKMAAVHNS